MNIDLPFYGGSNGWVPDLKEPFQGANKKHFSIGKGTPQYFNIVSELRLMKSGQHEATKNRFLIS